MTSEPATKLFSRVAKNVNYPNIEEQVFKEILPNDIIEISGDSGSGKTELLYHLIIACILPPTWREMKLNGHGIEVIFIDNDCHFNIFRLTSILEKRVKHIRDATRNRIETQDILKFVKERLKLLYIFKCFDSDQLIATLCSLENSLNSKCSQKIIMIDGLSTFYWVDRARVFNQMSKLNEHYLKIINTLKKLSQNCHVPIIVTKRELSKECSYDEKSFGQSWKNILAYQIKLIKQNFEENKILLISISKFDDENKACIITNDGLKFL